MRARPETIAGNHWVNAMIHRCFDAIDDVDVEQHYLKLFKERRSNNGAVSDIYRELLIGGYLALNGLGPRLYRAIGGERQRPDWELPHHQTVVEVFTLYAGADVLERLESGEFVHIDEERDLKRAGQKLADKARKYAALCASRALELCVAVCVEFSCILEPRQLIDDLSSGITTGGDHLAGLLVCRSLNAQREFMYKRLKRPGLSLPSHQVLGDFGGSG